MGELTRIYSCGKSMTTRELVESIPKDVQVDVWFPEIFTDTPYIDNEACHKIPTIPRTEYEQLMKCPGLVGKTFVTVSEIPILFMLREVRKGRLDNLELWCGDRRIHVGINGDMIDYWDGGFFELGFNLRFS